MWLFQLQNVYSGKAIVIDWRTAIEPVIRVKYSSSSGKAFIHHPRNPIYPPLLPVTWNFNKFNVWKDKFDKVGIGKMVLHVDAQDITLLPGDSVVHGGRPCPSMEGTNMGKNEG